MLQLSSNDETAGGHFPAGSKPFGGSRPESQVTEMNETAAILTIHPDLMGRLHRENAGVRSGVFVKNVSVAAGRGDIFV